MWYNVGLTWISYSSYQCLCLETAVYLNEIVIIINNFIYIHNDTFFLIFCNGIGNRVKGYGIFKFVENDIECHTKSGLSCLQLNAYDL